MNKNRNNILLVSIHPKYAKKIIEGKKTVELRKVAPKQVQPGNFMLIYVTSPIKEIWGVCRIARIHEEEPSKLWSRLGHLTGISHKEFDEYYRYKTNGFGIEIVDFKTVQPKSIDLDDLRELIPGFSPPQTYSYVDYELLQSEKFNGLLTSEMVNNYDKHLNYEVCSETNNVEKYLN